MSELIKLIEQWEHFSKANPKGTVAQFNTWCLNKTLITNGKKKQSNSEVHQDEMNFHANDKAFDKYPGNKKSSMQGAYLTFRLSQYVVYYTKPTMKKHGLHSIDDFGYLQNVRLHNQLTKTKACELMLQELTTGTDIIRRLVKNGFLKEKIDKVDRRQKLIELTSKGTKVLELMFIDFLEILDVLGNLKENERITLLNWLDSLDRFHDGFVKNNFR